MREIIEKALPWAESCFKGIWLPVYSGTLFSMAAPFPLLQPPDFLRVPSRPPDYIVVDVPGLVYLFIQFALASGKCVIWGAADFPVGNPLSI